MGEFRKDIQCLRGISLLFVFLYHYDKSMLPAGFIGVDIFFFISGFVNILSYLTKTNNNSLQFYVNRMKRIVPVSHLCLYLSIFLCMKKNILYQNKQLTNIIYTLFSLSNYRFIYLSVDYLSQSEAPSMVLHYWSLAIEDQFYLLFPYYIKYSYNNTTLLLLLSIASICYSLIINTNHHYVSYFSLLSRSYQFLLGILATKEIELLKIRKLIKNDIILIFLVLFCLFSHNDSYFPTPLSLFPLMMVYIIIKSRNNLFVLNNRILFELGNVSYSFYLLHYIILYTYSSKEKNSLYLFSIILIITFIISLIVNKLYENPIRKINNKLIIFWCFIISFTFILSICVVLIKSNMNFINNKYNSTHIVNSYNNNSNNEYVHVSSNKLMYSPYVLKKVWRDFQNNQCFCPFKNMKFLSILNKYPIVLLLSDSHGEQWFNTIIPYAIKMNYAVVHVWFWEDTIIKKDFAKIYKIFEYIPKVKYIVISHFLSDKSNNTIFKENYFFYLKILLKQCEEIYVIHDTPYFKEDPNICLVSSSNYDNCYSLIGINASHYFFPIYPSDRVHYINMIPYICYKSYKCFYAWNAIPIYLDNNHLSFHFTDTLSHKLLNHLHFLKQDVNISLNCNKSFKCGLSTDL